MQSDQFTKNGRELVHLGVLVDLDQRRQVQRLAREHDRSVSAEVRRALADHLEREADHPKDAA